MRNRLRNKVTAVTTSRTGPGLVDRHSVCWRGETTEAGKRGVCPGDVRGAGAGPAHPLWGSGPALTSSSLAVVLSIGVATSWPPTPGVRQPRGPVESGACLIPRRGDRWLSRRSSRRPGNGVSSPTESAPSPVPRWPRCSSPAGIPPPNTIDTVPEETLLAFADHGSLDDRLEPGYAAAERAIAAATDAGIDADALAEHLQRHGAGARTPSRASPNWRARPTTRPPTHSVWWSACSRPLCLMSSIRRPRSVSQASMVAL